MPDPSRHYHIVNAAGWLLFGIAMIVGSLTDMPGSVIVVMTPSYILIGYILSLALGPLYDRLDVGPSSFGRALTISVIASLVAGVIWTVAYYYYRHNIAQDLHSIVIGTQSTLRFRHGALVDGALVDGALPLLGWSLVRLGFTYSTALREQREQALRALAAARDAQLQMLAYQLNPHFLFNALNSIRALINEDRARARDMVTALAEYLRYALVERPLHVALLEEEVAAVRGYLAIEKVRFEDRLQIEMEIEPAALQCEVPAFLLNPLVENAVKHGTVCDDGSPLLLHVAACLVAPGRLRITVQNTGRLESAEQRAAARGVGLANVRARLAALHPGDHMVEIEEADGRVRVVVGLPARLRPARAP